ncbi:DUF2835 family protein [Pokkaliibacter sp. CJK22405]|uniref:DUF2835 family protein n=1 Tax=Pokkaliibacter sp. CJK22405 TaxID=3384615 RepID=UPI003984F040
MQYRFSLSLYPDELMRMYQGHARYLRVRTDSGKVIELAADRLRNVMTHAGVHGVFLLTTDDKNRFVSLQQLA